MVFLVLVASIAVTPDAAVAAANSQPPTLNQSVNAEFIAEHYPRAALTAGEQGKVGFKVTIEPNGSLATCDITQPSGFSSLDEATCDLIVRHARFQSVQDSEGRAVRAERLGYVNWKLPRGTVTASASTQGKPSNPDKIVCRRSPAPGSFIIKIKQCMTRAEWNRQERLVRDAVEGVRDRVYCNEHGCS